LAVSDYVLDHVLAFQGFNEEQIARIRPLFLLFYAPAGTVIFEQGEPAENLYVVTNGEVAIRYKPDDGPEGEIAHVRPEGVVGWSAALGNPRYTSSAVCTTDCQMLRLRNSDLRQLCESDPDTGALFLEKLATLVAERLRTTHPQLMALLEQGLAAQIAKPLATG
jgi:CRP/FNR family cyclic AMP-dependent transcriptional regulator